MIKRRIIFGSYDTAANGWTLAGWQLSAAEQKTNYVEKPGGDGSWDLSTAMTDGAPRYRDRTLTVTLECSEGDRLSREDRIRHMVNLLDGMREDIELPDDRDHYLRGRLHVAKNYNNLAHASVTVTATCEPWKYTYTGRAIALTATPTTQVAKIVNNGRRAEVPVIEVTGSSVLVSFGGVSKALTAGTYRLPDLVITPGVHELSYTGTGELVLTYREAVLE